MLLPSSVDAIPWMDDHDVPQYCGANGELLAGLADHDGVRRPRETGVETERSGVLRGTAVECAGRDGYAEGRGEGGRAARRPSDSRCCEAIGDRLRECAADPPSPSSEISRRLRGRSVLVCPT